MREIQTMREHADFLRILAHPTRLLILEALIHGTKCVNDLRELLDMPQPNVSQHLALLKEQGIVMCHKDGTSRCYHLARSGQVKALFAALRKDHPKLDAQALSKCRSRKRARRSAKA